MIKFLCASCGERLSVPDQNAGRKGVCPSCKAINRIPLDGSAQPQPANLVTARAYDVPPATTTRPKPAPTTSAPPRGNVRSPARSDVNAKPILSSNAPAQPLPPPDLEPFKNLAALLNAPAPAATRPADDDPADHVQIYVERRLPRPLKIAILIVAVLTIVGTLYCALYSALHAFLKAASQ